MINTSNFLINEIPKYHPESLGYIDWWKEQKRRCIEGYWQQGKWMPGKLYFYGNFGTILLNKAGSKVKNFSRPLIRDLEWEFFLLWEEARGFSGFKNDQWRICVREIKDWDNLDESSKITLRIKSPNAFPPLNQPKQYVDARTYLRTIHTVNLGVPLYEQNSKDMMMMGSRGFGKSYSVGVGIILHEWLFDGMTEYMTAAELESKSLKFKSEIVVGAADSKYSKDLLTKVELANMELPGGQMINGIYYPSPFAKQHAGTWSKEIIAKYSKKEGSTWVEKGSMSSIKHRTFADNPFAANGTRPGVMIFEEVGFFDNLIDSRNASVECQRDGIDKFGTMLFIGTGGDMEKGTVAASMMFRNPSGYDLLEFDDIWENTGKVGYFVPAYMGLNQFKNENGDTNVEAAKQYLENYRATLRKKSQGSHAIDDELQNRPITPSEMFLSRRGSDLPVDELQNRLITVKQENIQHVLAKPVKLSFDPSSPRGIKVERDVDKKLQPLLSYPTPEHLKHKRDGAVVIYEYPHEVNGEVPKDMYIIGHDPYNSDDPNGESLGAIYVLKTKKYELKGYGHDEIVASFIGRPYEGRKVVNENLLKLSMLYGDAKIFFEKGGNDVKQYFEKMKRLDLLASKPVTIFNSSFVTRTPQFDYGYSMGSKQTKSDAIKYLRDWLLEEYTTIRINGEDRIIRNLDKIPDEGLLQEMIAFNYTGNFDRVMGFVGCIIGLEETYNQYKPPKEKDVNELEFLIKNKNIFKHVNLKDYAIFS